MERLQYEKFAKIDALHWWFQGRREIADVMMSHISPRRDASIIDVGTGSGGMVNVLSRYGKLTAFEPDEATLRFTRDTYQDQSPDVQFIGGSWNNLRRLEGAFDVLTAFDVLEHCEDDTSTLIEWRKLIKPGGRLLLTVPAFPCLWGANDELSHHYRRYRRQTLHRALANAGLHVAKISYMNSIGFLPTWVSRNIKEPLDKLRKGGEALTPWDFSLPPEPLNRLLKISMAWEKHLLPAGALPFGTSLIAVADVPTAIRHREPVGAGATRRRG